MTTNYRAFIYAQLGYILLIILSLIMFPGASFFSTLLTMIGVWVFISMVYRRAPWRNSVGWWTLLIATTLMAVGVIVNVHYFTAQAGATTELPVLLNPDSARFYNDALYTTGYSQGVPTEIKNHGYGLLTSWLWHITGVTIVAPIVVNMIVMLLSIILCGGIAWRMLRGETPKSGRWIASCAMLMSASVCYFLNSGTLFLKEALIIFAFSLITFAMTSLVNCSSCRKVNITMMIMFGIGIVILVFLRYTFLFMPVIGILILVKWQRRQLSMGAMFLGICVLGWIMSIIFYSTSLVFDTTINIIEGEKLADSFFSGDPQHYAYNAVVDGYFDFPWWKRILYLPLSAAVQYLIPLPWGFADDIHYGYTLAYAHISFPWYAVGCLVLYYLLCAARRSPDILRRMTFWGLLMWLVPAYLFAGTVSRYTLPILPLLIPAAVYVASLWKTFTTMKRWIWCYSILLIIGLVGGYVMQKGGLG